jgi:hypothetical protein
VDGAKTLISVKKVLIVGGVLAAIGLVVKRRAPELGKIDWEKKFESMPDSAPPKWMFRNITVIRENTEQIIAMLEGQPAQGSEARDPASGTGSEDVEGAVP